MSPVTGVNLFNSWQGIPVAQPGSATLAIAPFIAIEIPIITSGERRTSREGQYRPPMLPVAAYSWSKVRRSALIPVVIHRYLYEVKA